MHGLSLNVKALVPMGGFMVLGQIEQSLSEKEWGETHFYEKTI